MTIDEQIEQAWEYYTELADDWLWETDEADKQEKWIAMSYAADRWADLKAEKRRMEDE